MSTTGVPGTDLNELQADHQRLRPPARRTGALPALRQRLRPHAAHGNRHRYKYYSRLRGGVNACPSQRLPADELDRAVLASLLETYRNHGLIRGAVALAFERANAARPRQAEELAGMDGEIRWAEDAIERYFHGFEVGTMTEPNCGPRIESAWMSALRRGTSPS